MSTQIDSIKDSFQTLILREVVLCEGLQSDIDVTKVISELGKNVSGPAAKVLAGIASTKLKKAGGAIVGGLAKAAIISATKQTNTLHTVRLFRKWIQQIKGDAESTAHSCCRAALCYSLCGEYIEAENWLKDAEKKVKDLARPNYIRGLCAGAEGEIEKSAEYLTLSLKGRAKTETKERIKEALSLLV